MADGLNCEVQEKGSRCLITAHLQPSLNSASLSSSSRQPEDLRILKLLFASLLIPVVLIAAVVSSFHVSRLSDVYFYPNWTQLYLEEKHGDIVICRVIPESGIGQAVTRIPATDGG